MAVIMEFYKFYRMDFIDLKALAELIHAVNAYMIRRSLCDMNSQNILKLFPTVLRKVVEKCDGDYTDILKHLNQEMETVFDRLELYHNPAPVDLRCLSIEHLMSQTPTEEWLEELDTDMETYLENLHRMGNLTLAAKKDNSKMGNLMWDYKNEVLKETAHLKLNLELMEIDKWNLEKIGSRTKDLIEKICEIYPYPEVSVTQKLDGSIVDEMTALDRCIELAAKGEEITCIRNRRTYKTLDNKRGFTVISSKMYPQGDKEKYWFGYREKRFEDINHCEEQYMVLGCRSQKLSVLKLPRTFIERSLDMLNTSVDSATGEVRHYHIVIFRNPDGKMSMLLSKPVLREVDISEYVCEE